MKKVMSVFLLLFAVSIIFAGCKKAADTPATDEPAATEEAPADQPAE